MSFQRLADVFTYVQAHDNLTSNEVLTLLALANAIGHTTDVAYPSLAKLQKTTKLARRTLQRTLRSLEDKNLLQTILARQGHGSSTYRLLLSPVQPINSPKITRVTLTPPRVTLTPYPSIQPEGEIPNLRARDVEDGKRGKSRKSQDSPLTFDLYKYLTPGSKLWQTIEQTVSDSERHQEKSSES